MQPYGRQNVLKQLLISTGSSSFPNDTKWDLRVEQSWRMNQFLPLLFGPTLVGAPERNYQSASGAAH